MPDTSSERRTRRTLVVLLGLLVTAAACGDVEPRSRTGSLGHAALQTQAASRGGSDQGTQHASLIAFVTDRDGNNEIYVMRPDGTEVRNLTENQASDEQPSWAPDGKRIVFVSDRDGNRDLYVMDVNGTGVTRLTHTPEDESMPAQAPDGKRIAYVAEEQREAYVHFMWADGSSPRRLCQGFGPAWSSDAQTLYLNQGQLPLLCRVPAWGGDVTPLTVADPLFNVGPRVSPDGSRILFSKVQVGEVAGATGMNYEVYVLTEATGVSQRLTSRPGLDHAMGWSPAGTQVLFCTDRDGNAEVYVMNEDGTSPVNLTNHPSRDSQAAWSP